jgi:hypothetical protein
VDLHIDNELYKVILKEYETSKNYYVRENFNVANNLCYVYFSSNALYEFDTVDCFKQKVVKEDRYEWKNKSALINGEKPRKEIFIRDIWRSWYVKGINNEISSYTKLVEFLKKQTEGLRVRCVGVSSGGFIAVIISLELNADSCYALAAQFSLSNHFDHLKQNTFLKKFTREEESEYYFEVWKRLSENKNKIIYLFPCKSDQDIEQKSFLPNLDNIFTVEINVSNHGIALYPNAISNFISLSFEDCQSFFKGNKLMKNKIYASIRIGGLNSFMSFVKKRVKKKYGKKN